MKNALVERLADLMDQVEEGKLESYQALNKFLREWGGAPVYIPNKRYSQIEIMITAHENGMSAIEISEKYGYQLNYVYTTLKKYRDGIISIL